MEKPKIRFKGYQEDWEQRKLGEVCEIKDSARIPNSEWEEDGVPYIRASDVTNENISGILFISQERYEFYKKRTGAPTKNDVLFNGGGEIGKSFLITDEKSIYVQGGAVLYARTSEANELVGQYLKTYFETKHARSYIDAASAGGTMKHFTLKPSQMMPILLPMIAEQEKIGKYFVTLDHLITLHQRKCEEMKTLKKYMLQKMFPQNGQSVPQIRFSGFTEDWEQRKLEDYLEVSSEKNRDELFGKEDVLSVSGEVGIVNQIEFQGRSFAGASVANYGIVEVGDVVYTKSPLKSNPYGIIKTNKGKTGIVSTLYAVYKPKENVDSEFVQIYFESDFRMNSYMHPLVNKGAKNDMKVSDANALKGPVFFPKIEEQIAISQYFNSLDHLITLHQQKCDELRNIKKFMLQNMFI